MDINQLTATLEEWPPDIAHHSQLNSSRLLKYGFNSAIATRFTVDSGTLLPTESFLTFVIIRGGNIQIHLYKPFSSLMRLTKNSVSSSF